MIDKIYPAIYSTPLKSTYLYLDKDTYCSLSFPITRNWLKASDLDDADLDTNITPEYLTNTYGEVQSTEHAEFIIELAVSHGIVILSAPWEDVTHFTIENGQLFFVACAGIDSTKLKQITIPLPPKQIQTATPEEEFEMEHIMKNAGDNLVLGCEDSIDNLCDRVADSIIKKNPIRSGCEDSKCDEWPEVGDEVLYDGNSFPEIKGETVEVIGVCSRVYGDKVLTIDSGVKGVMAIVFGPWIKKPKTPEEELRDELHGEFKELINMDASINAFVDMIETKYNITKKPQ